MKERLAKNFKTALPEVVASLIGTLGVVFIISFILSQQADGETLANTFEQYFKGGQIGLSILAVSGIIFIALGRHRPLNQFISLGLYAVLLVPMMATAFVIGLNPGFQENVLKDANLQFLWVVYLGFHVLWFLILLLAPEIPSAQEVGQQQEERVNRIKAGAVGRVE